MYTSAPDLCLREPCVSTSSMQCFTPLAGSAALRGGKATELLCVSCHVPLCTARISLSDEPAALDNSQDCTPKGAGTPPKRPMRRP